MAVHDIVDDIKSFRKSLMERNDGSWCFHEDYPCDKVMIDATPVWDTLADPPRLRSDIAMACLCKCPPCSALREARHVVMGVEGYPVGIVKRI